LDTYSQLERLAKEHFVAVNPTIKPDEIEILLLSIAADFKYAVENGEKYIDFLDGVVRIMD